MEKIPAVTRTQLEHCANYIKVSVSPFIIAFLFNKGEQGDQGAKGLDGAPGVPGLPGDPGRDGQRGLKGEKVYSITPDWVFLVVFLKKN